MCTFRCHCIRYTKRFVWHTARYECHDRIVRVKKKIPKMFDVEVAICVSLFITITRTSQQITVIIYRYRKSQYLTRATNPKKRR